MSLSRSARFRDLLKKPPFVCMGAHDAVTAKLAEAAGAPAIYVSGFVASAIVPYTELIDEIDDLLTLTGLRLLYERNA